MPETPETTTAQPAPETDPQIPDDPATEAVSHCINAYNAAYEECRNSNGGPGKASTYQCEKEGGIAFRDSLPTLSSRQDILNFIACVAEGVLLEAIPENTSSKLIYAAHAALRALPREPKPRKIKKHHPRGAKKGNRGEPQLTP
jgi:hypothetical protein